MLGIDIYQQYNDVTDWSQLTRDGVSVVWVKVTDGEGRAIVAADAYVAAAKGAGLAVGGYHYAESWPQAEIQADNFARELLRLGATDVAPMLDLEGTIPGPESFRERFWPHLRQTLPISPVTTYASESWWKAQLIDAPVVPGELIWVARYGPNDGADHGTSLPVWNIQQYTSVGVLAGIRGNVDLDNVQANVRTYYGISQPPAIETDEVEIMQVEAATDGYVYVPTNGKSGLFIQSGYGHDVTVKELTFIGPTPSVPVDDPNGRNYLGREHNWTFHSDRPGPAPVPAGTVVVALQYSSIVDFTVWCA